jgi:hypothetical protein
MSDTKDDEKVTSEQAQMCAVYLEEYLVSKDITQHIVTLDITTCKINEKGES